VIAVGGNSLSRGLTLEGLSTSYFLRNSRAYDTLLQMGRWFGYRDSYGDLCRLWMTEEAQGWYRHIAEATVELKRDFIRMKRLRAKPIEFGLRVRRHPESLLITARNKMSSGIDVVEASHEVSLGGRLVESARLYSDRHRNSENLRRVERFFERLVETCGEPSESPHGGALTWMDVPAEDVADFLDSFAIHPFNFDFQGDSIADFLRQTGKSSDPVFGTWTVALPTKGEMGEVALKSLPGKVVLARRRVVSLNASNGSLLVSGKSARVGGKADVRHGVPISDLPGGAAEEHEVRAAMKHPLLVIYLLRGEQKQGSGRDAPRTTYLDGAILPALGLHFPGVPESTQAIARLRYRLNRVAQQQLFEPDLGDDKFSDDLDDED